MSEAKYKELLGTMVEEYTSLSGHIPDRASDIGIRLQVFARQLADIWDAVEEVDQQAFPLTSSGAYLDMHAEARGLARKGATHAAGTLLFGRAYPAEADITIPKGTLCQTASEGGTVVETTEDGVMQAGTNSVEVPAQAREAGINGNILAGRVSVIITPVSGISTVGNPEAFSGGTDEEEDESLRERLRQLYRAIPNGTNCAFYRTQALTHPLVGSAKAISTPRGLGSVDVVLWGQGIPVQADVVQEVQTQLEQLREVNVDVSVYGATPLTCNLSLEVAPLEGSDFDVVAESCRGAVRGFFSGMEVGQSLLLCALAKVLLETTGVYNVKVGTPAADWHILANQILICGNVSITRMAVS